MQLTRVKNLRKLQDTQDLSPGTWAANNCIVEENSLVELPVNFGKRARDGASASFSNHDEEGSSVVCGIMGTLGDNCEK